MRQTPIDPNALAIAAYHAYGETTNFKNFRGEQMPTWNDLPEQIRKAWANAAGVVAHGFANMLTGDVGCFGKARANGEPTFTLRGQDRTAALTIHHWVELNKSTAPSEKLDEAMKIANEMRDWPAKKAAD